MTTFDCFPPETLRFLSDLKSNNTKDWFSANKTAYEIHLKEPGAQFAEALALALYELTGQTHSSKIYRIYRDVRFSKDKTPYNAHLHVAFTPDSSTTQPPMWFFGLSPNKLSLGCGVFQYGKETLATFRASMGGPLGAELIGLTETLQSAGIRVDDPDLKRVPSGFDKDHPNAEALRRKGFSAWIEHPDPGFVLHPDLLDRTIREFDQLMPVFKLLMQIR